MKVLFSAYIKSGTVCKCRHVFSIFFYFLRKVPCIFMKFFKDIFGITLTIRQKMIWYIAQIFKDILRYFSPIFAHYTILLVLRNQIYSHDVLHIFYCYYSEGHCSKQKKKFGSLSAWGIICNYIYLYANRFRLIRVFTYKVTIMLLLLYGRLNNPNEQTQWIFSVWYCDLYKTSSLDFHLCCLWNTSVKSPLSKNNQTSGGGDPALLKKLKTIHVLKAWACFFLLCRHLSTIFATTQNNVFSNTVVSFLSHETQCLKLTYNLLCYHTFITQKHHLIQ